MSRRRKALESNRLNNEQKESIVKRKTELIRRELDEIERLIKTEIPCRKAHLKGILKEMRIIEEQSQEAKGSLSKGASGEKLRSFYG